MEFTSPHSRGRSLCHQPHHTGKPGSTRQPSSPHTGWQLLTHLWSLPRLNALAARAVPNVAQDTAPTPQLQSAQTLLQPRNPPAPKSQPQTARRSLQRLTVLASMAVPLLLPLGQMDANGEMFAWKTPTPLTPQLTIDQANSIFNLVAECQALGVKLAKEFHVLSGLEAMHRNSIQGMVHETLTLGHSAQEAYSTILWDDITEAEHEATTHCLHSEADAMWKEMHEVMYNDQLDYDWQLSTFLKEMETTLTNMRDQVWVTIHTLAENEGIMFNDCLGHALQVLNLLLQIPVDISFQTQIPLTIVYCLESSIYRRWCPEQGGVLSLHKEVRASWTLSKVLGRATHQPSEGVDCPPSPATSDNSMGSGGLWGSRDRSCSHA